MAAAGYAAHIQATFYFGLQFVQESDIYQNYSVNNPAINVLKVHWHGCMCPLQQTVF
jgi:hypothetical protein